MRKSNDYNLRSHNEFEVEWLDSKNKIEDLLSLEDGIHR